MARIEFLEQASATPEQLAAIDEELRLRGKMTNLKRIQAHSPDALRIYGEWFTLWDRLVGQLGAPALLFLCLAISRAQDAEIPVGYFKRALTALGIDPDSPVTDARQSALLAFGTALGASRGKVAEPIWSAATSGLASPALADFAAFCGIMVATTTFANLVEASPDAEILPFLKS